MSSILKYRWILLLMIWTGNFYLTYANIEIIDKILIDREQMEILQMDMAFWKQNSSNISRVVDQRGSLEHEIESLKLGIVFLNDTINKLGDRFDLSELKMEMDPSQSQGNSIQGRLSFRSIIMNGIDTISTIQRDYPFLSFQIVKILPERKGNLAKFEISFNYRYLIADIQ